MSVVPGWEKIDEVNQNVVWLDQSFEAHIKDINLSIHENETLMIVIQENKTHMIECLAWKHCKDTEIPDKYDCPHLFLKMQKLTGM